MEKQDLLFTEREYEIPTEKGSLIPTKKGSLYLASIHETIALLKDNPDARVISLLSEYTNWNIPEERKLFFLIDDKDGEQDLMRKHLPVTYDFIEKCLQNNGTVIVHCFAGVSRSATIVLHYLMKKDECNPSDAMEFLKKYRPQVNPGDWFYEMLWEVCYEEEYDKNFR